MLPKRLPRMSVLDAWTRMRREVGHGFAGWGVKQDRCTVNCNCALGPLSPGLFTLSTWCCGAD